MSSNNNVDTLFVNYDGTNYHKTRIDRLPCYDCPSSDGVSIYQNKGEKDGKIYHLAKCFSCGEVTHETKFKQKGYSEFIDMEVNTDKPPSVSDAFNRRHEVSAPPQTVTWPEVFTPDNLVLGIEPDVFERYGVGVQYGDATDTTKATLIAYPYFEGTNLVAMKIRNYTRPDKKDQFAVLGQLNRGGLFGSQLFKPGGKYLTIVEGEKDALSAFQMLGKRSPVVSIKSGTSALTSEVQKYFEYVNSFEEIRICMDPDQPGNQAVKKLCEANLINPSKLKIVRLNPTVGDVNEYLQQGLVKEFVDAIYNAHPYTPDDVFIGKSLVDQCINEPQVKCYNYPFHALNEVTFGLRKGELDVWVADTGVGKSTIYKHIVQELLLNHQQEKIGMFMFEELPKRTLRDLVGLQMGRRLHLPNEPLNPDDFRETAKQLNLENLVIWGNFGSTDVDVIMKKLEYVVSQGCEFIFLDHISMITADQRNNDERAALDQVINYLNNFVTAKNIHISVIAHTNREGQIRGTSGIEKVAHKVVRIDREKKHPDPILRNVVRLSVEKNRFNGELGLAGFLEFNTDTGRLIERPDLDDETFYEHKNRGRSQDSSQRY